MNLKLTDEQIRAVADHPNEPLRLIDPTSNRAYVLVDAESYEKLKGDLSQEFRLSDAYPAIDRAFAEGWNAPGMDDYDRYEEFKR